MQEFRVLFDRNAQVFGEIMEPCCKDMKKAYCDKVIGFGDINDPMRPGDKINIYAYDLQKDVFNLYPITRCPFCGTKVTVEATHFT